jgi:hypothetical protein
MKRIIAFTGIFFLFVYIANAWTFKDLNAVSGKWKYQVTSAPEGYQNGVMVLTVKDNALNGEVSLPDGGKIIMRDAVYEKDTLTFTVNVDYEYIKIKLTVNGNKMKGVVNSPDGPLALTAEKIE